MKISLVLLSLTLSACMPYVPHGHAQTNHHEHHAVYQSWVNKADKGCCNNQDCGTVKDGGERDSATGTEVLVEGAWCPVLAHHYLKRGNAPDWSQSHVCVRKLYEGADASSPCERLLCYQPKPGI